MPIEFGLPTSNRIAHMKTQLYQVAVVATVTAALISCDDNPFAQQDSNAPATGEAAASAEVQTTADTPELPAITPEEVNVGFAPRISGMKFLSQESIAISTTPKANGDLQVKAKIKLKITEDLYSRSEKPAEFGEARKQVFELYQTVMRPDSSYLLDMGAENSLLRDEDREVPALPEDLQQLYNEMANLSEGYCFKLAHPAGTNLELELTMDARWQDGKWNTSNIIETEDILTPLSFLAPASTLEQNAPILTQEFIAARITEIAAKADSFKTAAEAYHKTREEAAATKLSERRAKEFEEKLKQEEEAQKAAEAEAAKKEWSDFCIKYFSPGCKFTGEWTRDGRFGELTISINGATMHENAIQFHGELYDTKLPQARIGITGRCSMTKDEDGTSKVNIILYEGQYDPDEPTAEIYDAPDGRMILNFDKKGNLGGIMTRAAWIETPKKSFSVHFKPAPQKTQK